MTWGGGGGGGGEEKHGKEKIGGRGNRNRTYKSEGRECLFCCEMTVEKELQGKDEIGGGAEIFCKEKSY